MQRHHAPRSKPAHIFNLLKSIPLPSKAVDLDFVHLGTVYSLGLTTSFEENHIYILPLSGIECLPKCYEISACIKVNDRLTLFEAS